MESQVIYSNSHSWHAGAGDRTGCPAWEAVIQCVAWWVGREWHEMDGEEVGVRPASDMAL